MLFEDTLEKFGYPESLLSENKYWYTLLRPNQTTFASLILIARHKKNSSFSDLNISEQSAMFDSIKIIEEVLFNKIGCDKINYLALMMVDPFVHYHILPRYKKPLIFKEIKFLDPGFPGIPDLGYKTPVTETEFSELVIYLKSLFNE